MPGEVAGRVVGALGGLALLLLHGANGREIRINPRNVTSLHAPVPGQHNKVLAEGIGCLINTSDGKFVSVVETCAAVARMIGTPETVKAGAPP